MFAQTKIYGSSKTIVVLLHSTTAHTLPVYAHKFSEFYHAHIACCIITQLSINVAHAKRRTRLYFRQRTKSLFRCFIFISLKKRWFFFLKMRNELLFNLKFYALENLYFLFCNRIFVLLLIRMRILLVNSLFAHSVLVTFPPMGHQMFNIDLPTHSCTSKSIENREFKPENII